MGIFRRKPVANLHELLVRIQRDQARKELSIGTLRELGLIFFLVGIVALCIWGRTHVQH